MVETQSYEIPSDCRYTKDHEWIRAMGSNYLVGITDYAAKMLNDIVYVNLPNVGMTFNRKDVFGQVESVKTVSDLYMPVSGKILKANSKLTQTPELVSNSPYADGWMLEIQSESFSSEEKDLLDAKAYEEFIEKIQETN